MSRALRVIGIAVLVVLAVLIIGATVPVPSGTARSDPPPDALPFAARGTYPVGTRDLVLDREAPMDITMWYPAQGVEPRQLRIAYPYAIKMGAPLGTVTFARFKGQAAHDAPYDLAAGPYPLVVLSPGLSIGAASYAWLAEHLASYGFVVIALEHDEHFDGEMNMLWQAVISRPVDVLDALAYVDEQAEAGGMLEKLVDAETVAVIGHSYGGYTSLVAGGARIDTAGFTTRCKTAEADDPGLWLCDGVLPHLPEMARLAGLDAVPAELWPSWSDPRVDAIVTIAGDAHFFGQAGLAEITAPLMAIGGTADTDAPYTWGSQPSYEYVSSSAKALVTLEDAEHMIFAGPCEGSPLLLRFVSAEFCADTGWDRYRAHDLTAHFATAFLLAELHQDADAAAALAPQAVDLPDAAYEAQGY